MPYSPPEFSSRRAFIGGMTLALAASSTSMAQGYLRRVAWVATMSPEEDKVSADIFRNSLRSKGWVEGENIHIEWFWGRNELERVDALVRDAVSYDPEAVVAQTAGIAVKLATLNGKMPIITLRAGSLEGTGLIKSLSKPGKNVTGSQIFSPDLIVKRVEIIKEIIPNLKGIAYIEPLTASAILPEIYIESAMNAANQFGLDFYRYTVHKVEDFDAVFGEIESRRIEAALVPANPLTTNNGKVIVDSALNHRLPTGYEYAELVRLGGLMSYGPRKNQFPAIAADYVDKILRGAFPGDLPIQMPTEFELAVNMKTAATLGLTIPFSVLSRAAELIE